MSELYVVKIEYYDYMKFSESKFWCDVKIFSSKEKAEEFLINNGFLYGKSSFFDEIGWYHSNCIKPRLFETNRLGCASIDRMKIDDEDYDYFLWR